MLLIPFYIFSLNHRHSLVLERMCHLSMKLTTLTDGIRPPMTHGVQVKETRFEFRPYSNLSKYISVIGITIRLYPLTGAWRWRSACN